jgi:type I restriction enzyme S subunit
MAGDSKEVARAHLADAGVGELPDDWDVVTLGDLFTEDRGIAVGVMYPGDHDPEGVPLIKAGDLNGSIINPRPDFRISKDKHHEYRRTALEGGELLMTLVGNVGQCAVVPPRMAGWNTARAVAVMRLADSSDTHFIQQCLLSRPLQHLMDVWCNTTVQATLNLKEIRQLPLPWPPKHSRDAIAAFGKALDDKIELNRRMNETLESLARRLFKSWFVDFDPVRAKLDGRPPAGLDKTTAAQFPNSFQDSTLGSIPKGWATGSILRQADLLSGGTPKTDVMAYWDGDVPWASAKDVSQCGEVFLVSTERTITKQGVEESSTKIIPASSTVVVARGATTGRLTMFAHAMAMNQTCYGLRSKIGAPYALYCNARNFIERLVQRGHGSIFDTITTSTFEATDVLLAPKEMLLAFDKEVTPMFKQVHANLLQSRTLATLRNTLLPKLLSGELSVAEAAAIEAE